MADQTIYLKVKNWGRFQQYKDGRPLRWIKLYVKILGDYEFEQIPEPTQLHLMKVWLLAAESDNRIPCNPEWIARRIGAKSPVDVKTMVEEGWLGVHGPHDVDNALKYLSDGDVQSRTGHRTQHALAREEKRREEKSTLGSSLRSSPNEAEPRVDNSQDEGKPNRWSGTVDALREHFWQADQPPGNRTIGQELSVAKQVCRTYNLDPPEFVEAVEGFAQLRKAGRWEGWVEKGEACHALVLNRTPEDANGIPVVIRSLHEARKNHTPPEKRGRSGPVPLSEAIAGG